MEKRKKPREVPQLEQDLRDFRSGVAQASAVFRNLEGAAFDTFETLKEIKVNENTFCHKYILFVIQEHHFDNASEDRLLAALGLLVGYETIGVQERHTVYCKNVGICKNGIDKPLDQYWSQKDIHKNLNSKENSLIKKLVNGLQKRMNINNGRLGYVEDSCIVSKIEGLTYPKPHYLHEEGYRKCEIDGRVFYVPPTTAELRLLANTAKPELKPCLKLEPAPEFKPDMGTEKEPAKAQLYRQQNHRQTLLPISSPLVPGWGDDGGCRPSYTVAQVNGGILGDRIVFNSISDGVIGNEKNFVGIREDDGAYNGQENHWKCDYITVEDGKVYILRLYIHNDNPDHKEAIAKEVMAAFSLSPGSAKEHLISGNIRSSNAQPKHYWASIVLRSNTAPFHIEYVWGSADLEGNYVNGSPRMHRLSDRIVTKASAGGVLIDADYDTRDGRIPGSFAYACYVGIRIRVVFDKVEENTDYTFSQKVRLDDSKKWEDYSITTEIGDIVEFQMAYANKSNVGLWHENVTVQTLLPEGLEYIPGSTVLYNSKYKAGKSLTEDDILAPRALCIGAYKPKANAFVRFKAKVIGRKSLPILINRAQCCVGNSSLVDDVEIVVLY